MDSAGSLISRVASIGPVAHLRRSASEAVIGGVDQAIATRWEPAQERAARLVGANRDEKMAALGRVYSRELGFVGAAAGGAAALPAVGTGAVVASTFVEIGYFSMRSSELVLTVGALHGHHQATIEEQRAWILSVLLFGSGAAEGFVRLAGELGQGLGRNATRAIPISALRSINHAAGRTLVPKYGTTRGVVAVGRVLPFGIGAAVGGGANYASVRLIAKHADRFFDNLPFQRVVPDSDRMVD